VLIAVINLVVAAVLAVSGTVKLLDLRGSAATLRAFGVPDLLVPSLAVLLPLAELAIAAALLPAATAQVAAAAAVALFVAFTVAIAVTLVSGRRPDCGCFGRLHSKPVGVPTLIRTIGLAGLAGIAAYAGTGGSAADPLFREPITWLVALVVAQSVLLVALLRRHGRMLAQLAGEPEQRSALRAGELAPAFTLADAVTDELVALDDLLVARSPLLLVFADPGCGSCMSLLPEVAEWQRSGRRVAVISRGDPGLNRVYAGEHGLELVLLQEDREVADAYGVALTPSAIVLDGSGRVSAALVYGADEIREHAHALEPRVPPPLVVLASSMAGAALFAESADAGIAVDDAQAYRQIRQIIKATSPKIVARERRFGNAVNAMYVAADRRGAKFKVLAETALLKRELQRAFEQLDAVKVPGYQRGEKNPSRIAQSHATSTMRLLDLTLDRFVKTLDATQKRSIERLYDDMVGLLLDAEQHRRSLARMLGCTNKLENC
jgi:peroxiredoxin